MIDLNLFDFNNTYTSLPTKFFQRVAPTPVLSPHLIHFNNELAQEIMMDISHTSCENLANIFSGNQLPNKADPIAMAYAGHQFGSFVPQLGDGRALLLGEVIGSSGQRWDIQLKGSGPTAYSRGGDGRSALGPVLREYIVSEAMHYLGIPTSRALAAVTTGELVERDTPLPGGILTRVAPSHLRVGTFEFFAARQDCEGLRQLLHYSVDRHFPEIRQENNLGLAFLHAVCSRQAKLLAQWMSVGFIHGVMNTDNFSIAGHTLDYGPCAFMDSYHPNQVFSSIDRRGRYAYSRQPTIAQWNLAQLANSLITLEDVSSQHELKAWEEVIVNFEQLYDEEWTIRMGRKLGLSTPNQKDKGLIQLWLTYLQKEQLDFTISFRKLSTLVDVQNVCREIPQTQAFRDFEATWRQRLQEQSLTNSEVKDLMDANNPVVIPRNHQIERTIRLGVHGDFSAFKEMIEVLRQPFIDQPKYSPYQRAPLADEIVTATFCGT
jgi:uncharacterized protein YdiU (UPF0061 family)